MKILKYSINTMLAVALLTSSCQRDLLSPKLTTAISDATAFDTPDRIAQQVNGLYAAVKSGNYLGGRYFVYNEIRAENYDNLRTNGVTGLQTWNHTLISSSNEVNNLWNACYAAINACNLFLDGMAAKGTSVINNPTLSNQYIAEARMLRGMIYYDLLQLYARPYWDGNGSKEGLPLRLTGNKGSGSNDLARSTVAQVYAQVLDDLNFAEANLPLTISDPLTRTTRAHRNTAIALKTRVLLSMQNYAGVITEANKIVSTTAPFVASSGVPHALAPSVASVFAPPYTTTESIFSMPFTANNLPGTQNALCYYFSPTPAGNSEYPLVGGILTAYGSNDARFTALTVLNSGRRWVNKYPTGPVQTDYAPVIRYAEVLLNLAEALARQATGVDVRALAILNAVRQRSEPSAVLAPVTKQDLIDAILNERRLELLGEGRRSPDLLRLGLPLPAKVNVNAINPSQSEYIWPIPDGELLQNKLMTKNP